MHAAKELQPGNVAAEEGEKVDVARILAPVMR